MNMFMYRLSRYWNRIPYALVDIARLLIWDQTGKNKDIMEDFTDETLRAILTDTV